jgi:hypothetical protein
MDRHNADNAECKAAAETAKPTASTRLGSLARDLRPLKLTLTGWHRRSPDARSTGEAPNLGPPQTPADEALA